MEELTKNKIFKFLFWIFILISLVHIGYTIYTYRGMYMDGSYYLLTQLCNLSQNKYTIVINATIDIDINIKKNFLSSFNLNKSSFKSFLKKKHNAINDNK